ncbi:MAG: response regulator transcription factor [Bacteroidales bacterium]|nr:response regulator transcription factor [Bacteroidales bacterium]
MTETPQTTCAIVDDEAMARYGIRSYICKTPGLKCVAELRDASELENYLDHNPTPDIIFLDIQMPEISGLDFIASRTVESAIIVVSAYEEYAIRGFELNVCDYLLKPVSYPRFTQAIEKAEQYLAYRKGPNRDKAIYVRAEKVYRRIRTETILYLESIENYVRIHTVTERIMTRITLKELIATLPPNMFIRLHKSYVVNLTMVSEIRRSSVVMEGGEELPMSRRYREDVVRVASEC